MHFWVIVGAVRPVRMDLSSRAAIDTSCETLGTELHQVDLLINNAGLMTGGLLEEQELGDVYRMFQVNLVAVAHLTTRVLPGMLARGSGLVVNNASISGYAHFPGASTHAASKAGVIAFTEALRRELRGTGVSVHLVTPGVGTDMLHATMEVYGPAHGHNGMGASERAGLGGQHRPGGALRSPRSGSRRQGALGVPRGARTGVAA